jgi:FkbM family methyltransferase
MPVELGRVHRRQLAISLLERSRLGRALRERVWHVRFAGQTATLGRGPLARLKLFALAWRSNRHWSLRRPVRLRLRALGHSFRCEIGDYSQLHVLREIFLSEEYRIDDLPPPATILDLGSNMGASLIYFRLRYPRARIVGVEVDPLVFPTLERNIAPFSGIELANVGVAGASGEATLFHNEQSWASSLKPIWETATQFTVPTRSLEDLLDDFDLPVLDLLKIDVEGAEWDVLPSFRGFDRIQTIVGEVHRVEDQPAHRLLDCLGDFRVSVTFEMDDVLLRFVARRD